MMIWPLSWIFRKIDRLLDPSPDEESRFLRRFMTGHDERHRFAWVHKYRVPTVILPGGGYELLYREDGGDHYVYLLNLDIPMGTLPADPWRERVFTVAARIGAEVIPLSERAYRKAIKGAQYPQLIHRDGRESVFRLTDKDTGEFRFYLSGYDSQEDPPLYFLCQLPHEVGTIEAAREALKPDSVRAALDAGVTVRRQGDLFFIQTDLDNDAITMAGAVVSAAGDSESLYGTAHLAQYSAAMPSGVMLASGIVRHQPGARPPDHHALDLGDSWWFVARNTVPAERTPENAPSTVRPTGWGSIFESWLGQAMTMEDLTAALNSVWGTR